MLHLFVKQFKQVQYQPKCDLLNLICCIAIQQYRQVDRWGICSEEYLRLETNSGCLSVHAIFSFSFIHITLQMPTKFILMRQYMQNVTLIHCQTERFTKQLVERWWSKCIHIEGSYPKARDC